MDKQNIMKLKTFIFTLFSIILITLLFIAFIPTLLSTDIGKKSLVKLVQKNGYKNFSANSFALSWRGPQKIEGLRLYSDSLDFIANHFETDMDFLSLLNLSKFDNKAIISLKAKISLKDASLKINYPNMPIANLTDINGDIVTNGEDQPINILLTGKSLINDQAGTFDVSSSVGHNIKIGTIKLKNFPTIAFDEIIFQDLDPNKGIITQILGQKTNLNSTFKIINSEGTIVLDVLSSHVKSKLSANYLNGIITLNAPLDASIILSEKLCKTLIKDVNPLLIYGLKAFNPIKIKISPEGFSLPIHPFNLEEVKVENAMIDFGKILTKNGKNISTVIGIMKYHSLEEVKEMNIWCGPVNVKISGGTLFSSRMDALLADEIHICTWGAVDLLSKKIKMTLGLTAEALERGFGIKDMPSNYVMKIPMKGTTEYLKIEKGPAAAKIAALLALQSAEKKSVFGQILDAFKHAGEDQSDVPPPILPLPWEK